MADGKKGGIEVEGLIDGQRLVYHLTNIHFHTESEHTVNNKHFPIEMHMVHSLDDDYTKYTAHTKLVIGVFFTDEEANSEDNSLLEAFKIDTLEVTFLLIP